MLLTVRVSNLLVMAAIALGLTPTSAHVAPESSVGPALTAPEARPPAGRPPVDDLAGLTPEKIFRVAYLDDALLQSPVRSATRSGVESPVLPSANFSEIDAVETRISGWRLPEPGTGSVLLATAALSIFFFMRRLAR